jgi:hypothetical protein
MEYQTKLLYRGQDRVRIETDDPVVIDQMEGVAKGAAARGERRAFELAIDQAQLHFPHLLGEA